MAERDRTQDSRAEAQAALSRLLLDKVRADTYPSVTRMAMRRIELFAARL